jgi:hypothetical protein
VGEPLVVLDVLLDDVERQRRVEDRLGGELRGHQLPRRGREPLQRTL